MKTASLSTPRFVPAMCRPSNSLLALACALLLASGAAHARSSDRNQPMDAEADHTSYFADDEGKPSVLTGNVVITQGSLRIHAARADVYQRRGTVSRTVLTGSPVRLSQQMDDGTPLNVQANRVDYDMQTEIVTLTGGVSVSQPRGSMRGERVVYNMKTGEVQSGGQGGGRVRMTIQPRNAAGGE